jgi:hypothetical protein
MGTQRDKEKHEKPCFWGTMWHHKRMPASASLKPHKMPSRVVAGKLAWCLNVPSELSETGKRQRLFYETEREAKVESEKLKARADNFGISLREMSTVRIAKAAEAYKLLEPYGIELLDCVRAHIAILDQRRSSVTFGAAFDHFAELKKNKSVGYRQEIRHARATFGALLDRKICDITAADLAPILNKLPDGSRNAKMRRLRSVFNLAIKRGWMEQGTSPSRV